jgi:FkbM family methyltransferase
MKIKECKYGKMAYLPNDTYIGGSLEAYGEQHETELQVLFQLVKEGDTVIDVGANIGTISIPMAKHVGKSGKVISFEPQIGLFNLLSKNVELNTLDNIETRNSPVGRKSGLTVRIPQVDYDSDFNFGSVSMVNSSSDGVPAKTVCLDDLVEKISKPSLIKIDVEGMEDEVLLGAKELINWARPCIDLEFTGNQIAILHSLKNMGYNYKVFEPPLFNPDNFQNNKENVFERHIVSLNIICWPSEKVFEVESPWFPNIWKNTNPLNSRHLEYRKFEIDFSEEYSPLNSLLSKLERSEELPEFYC